MDSAWTARLDKLDTKHADAVLEKLFPALFRFICENHRNDVSAGLSCLFSSAAVRKFLAVESPAVRSLYAPQVSLQLALQVVQAVRTTLENVPDTDHAWVLALVRPVIERASSEILQAVEATLGVILGGLSEAAVVQLGIEVVLRVRRQASLFHSEDVLVPLIAPVHSRVLDVDVFEGRWWWGWWDRGEEFRKWVAELWFDRSWRPERLVDAARGDERLILGLLSWFAGRWGARARTFLERMAENVESDPDWSDTVRRAARQLSR
jgi:hypothetical protein